MVQCHNSKGHSREFEAELGCLWKGVTRTTTRKARARRRGTEEDEDNDGDEDSDCESEDEEEDDNDHADFKEGKVPMTPELFQKTCMWLLQWGTMEEIFGALFIALSWHLACQGNNTAKVQFSHISWTSFDHMDVNFKHTKMQQHGKAKRQKRAVYSNPYEHYIDIPFLLGLYLSCRCSFTQARGRKLFLGSSQSQLDRASAILKKVLKENKQEVLSMDYNSNTDIGLHSNGKGVPTYLASLPGGPSPAALCLRGGWSMGQVKDIYFHQTQGGDKFTGRCSTLLNMMNGEFASSPAFFDDGVDANWMTKTIGKVFPNFQPVVGMDRILRISLASLIHHREKVMAFDANHIARSIPIF